jgi:short-subunit dehydrogenase
MMPASPTPLEGKSIVMTGGSGGIGAPLAELLVSQNAAITMIGRRTGPVAPRRMIDADLATDEGIAAAAAAIAEIEPDILIHLAGSQYFGPFAKQSDGQIQAAYRINLLAPVALTRAAIPAMLGRRRGHVLFAGSVFGGIPFAHFATYSSAKAGLAAFCTALQREYAESGIIFTCAVPRAVRTAMATPSIRRFAQLAGFKFDDPDLIARRLAAIVMAGGGEIAPGFPESFFMRLNALSPALVARGLAATDRKARRLLALSSENSKE